MEGKAEQDSEFVYELLDEDHVQAGAESLADSFLDREPISRLCNASFEANMEFYPYYLRANYVGKGESYVCRLKSDKCRVVGIFTGRDITAEYDVPEEDAEEAAEWRSCDVFVEQAHHDYQQMMTEKLQVRTPQHCNTLILIVRNRGIRVYISILIYWGFRVTGRGEELGWSLQNVSLLARQREDTNLPLYWHLPLIRNGFFEDKDLSLDSRCHTANSSLTTLILSLQSKTHPRRLCTTSVSGEEEDLNNK